MNTSRLSIRTWDVAALLLTLGTSVFALLTAITFDTFIDKPEGGGSVTTRLPGVVYAAATVMKVCLVSGLIAIVLALVIRTYKRLVTKSSEATTRSLPTWAVISVALTSLTPLVGAIAVVVAQTLVEKPNGISLSYFPQIVRTGVFVMIAQLSIAAVLALVSLVRREGLGISFLGLLMNALLLILFWRFEFYALGFDQDNWAPH